MYIHNYNYYYGLIRFYYCLKRNANVIIDILFIGNYDGSEIIVKGSRQSINRYISSGIEECPRSGEEHYMTITTSPSRVTRLRRRIYTYLNGKSSVTAETKVFERSERIQ